MKKNIIIEYKENYIEVSISGEISSNEYINFFNENAKRKDLPRKLRILGLDNNSKLIFSVSGAMAIAKARNNFIKEYENVRHAMVVNNPKNTALAVLSATAARKNNYQIKIFSSKENALEWLLR